MDNDMVETMKIFERRLINLENKSISLELKLEELMNGQTDQQNPERNPKASISTLLNNHAKFNEKKNNTAHLHTQTHFVEGDHVHKNNHKTLYSKDNMIKLRSDDSHNNQVTYDLGFSSLSGIPFSESETKETGRGFLDKVNVWYGDRRKSSGETEPATFNEDKPLTYKSKLIPAGPLSSPIQHQNRKSLPNLNRKSSWPMDRNSQQEGGDRRRHSSINGHRTVVLEDKTVKEPHGRAPLSSFFSNIAADAAALDDPIEPPTRGRGHGSQVPKKTTPRGKTVAKEKEKDPLDAIIDSVYGNKRDGVSAPDSTSPPETKSEMRFGLVVQFPPEDDATKSATSQPTGV